MAVNQCAPCSDPCVRSAAVNTEPGFREAVINILCSLLQTQLPEAEGGDAIVHINGTYNGTNQEILAAPGAGFAWRIRSLHANTEDANTDWKLGSTSTATSGASPNFDYLSNAGVVLGINPDGWYQTEENESLVITSNGPVDLIGSAIKVAV